MSMYTVVLKLEGGLIKEAYCTDKNIVNLIVIDTDKESGTDVRSVKMNGNITELNYDLQKHYRDAYNELVSEHVVYEESLGFSVLDVDINSVTIDTLRFLDKISKVW